MSRILRSTSLALGSLSTAGLVLGLLSLQTASADPGRICGSVVFTNGAYECSPNGTNCLFLKTCQDDGTPLLAEACTCQY